MTSIDTVRIDDSDDWFRLFGAYLDFYETRLDRKTIEGAFARIASPYMSLHGAIARDDNGRAVGLVHWLTHPATWTSTDYCYLEDLFVEPAARNSGIGTALIEHVQAWAQEHGSTKVYWLTAETNATARALYDGLSQRSGMIQYQIPLRSPS